MAWFLLPDAGYGFTFTYVTFSEYLNSCSSLVAFPLLLSSTRLANLTRTTNADWFANAGPGKCVGIPSLARRTSSLDRKSVV